MGAFSSKKTLYGDTARIPQVAEKIRQAFVSEGYEVRIEDPASGNESLSLKVDFSKQHWDYVLRWKLP